MDKWISVTLLLGSVSNFAPTCTAESESLNIIAFSKNPVQPKSCCNAMSFAFKSPMKRVAYCAGNRN
jgi:hypothetical protein